MRPTPPPIPLTAPEVRRLLVRLAFGRPADPERALACSLCRRRHQAAARACRYRTRGHPSRKLQL